MHQLDKATKPPSSRSGEPSKIGLSDLQAPVRHRQKIRQSGYSTRKKKKKKHGKKPVGKCTRWHVVPPGPRAAHHPRRPGPGGTTCHRVHRFDKFFDQRAILTSQVRNVFEGRQQEISGVSAWFEVGPVTL